MDSDFAGDPVSRKSTTGLVAQIGNHTVKSGSTLQSFTALSVGETEFYVVVKGSQVGLALRSIHQDLGVPMKVEIQSDSSTAKSLTDRLGARQRTKHSVTRYFWVQERPQYQEGAHSEKLRTCWNEASLCFSATTPLHVCRIGILLSMDPTLYYKMYQGSHNCCHEPTSDVQIGDAEQTIISIGREHRDGCKAE